MDVIVLEDDRSLVRLVPELGGAIADMHARLPDGTESPVLRPWSKSSEDGPFALGCNVLVPFSNRISGGGFPFGGSFHEIPPNLSGEDLPIHGDGFQRAWEAVQVSDSAATLVLDNGDIGPFRYGAELHYALNDGALTATLTVTNKADAALPFGGGFHPWLPRTPRTRLCFASDGVWLEDDRHLPTEHVPVTDRPEWDFGEGGAPLPPTWINNAFTGWHGAARIEQPDHGIGTDITASSNLDVAIVFSPAADADFFCFEPVSHAVDAHNQPGQPGLVRLAPGDSFEAALTLAWSPLD